jgi:hypothetical protein
VLSEKVAVGKLFSGKSSPARQDLTRYLAEGIGQNADGTPGPLSKTLRFSEFTSLGYEVLSSLDWVYARNNEPHAEFTVGIAKS